MQQFMAGTNPLYIDEDLVYTVALGPSTLEGVTEYLALIEPVFAKYGTAFLLTDATITLEVSGPARRLIAEWGKTHHVAASAIFGPGPMARATLTLITAAMKILSNTDQNMRFFATESEARAWLDAERQAYYARHPRPEP